MNKEEILTILRKYNFDTDKYIVTLEASMVLQGLKDTASKIDIACTKEYLDSLLKEDSSLKDKFNFSTEYNTKEKVMFEGLPIQSLEGVRNLKRKTSSSEDIKDINLINKYLELNPLALAYLGDSVYEVYIRKYLIDKGITKVNDLTKTAKDYVSAKSQSKILNKLIDTNFLTEDELEIIRRGRNSKSHKAPKNTDIITYKYATGFECLIGYLYLQNNNDRIKLIMKEIIGD